MNTIKYKVSLEKRRSKYKYDVLKFIFSEYELQNYSAIMLYDLLLEFFEFKDPNVISYDSIRKWLIRYRMKPSTNIRSTVVDKPIFQQKTKKINLNFSTPNESIDQPIINILKHEKE